ncbi:hypothetical protein GJ496_011719 [Pomphorhynchus laevis]|nr:hypothetical protein GJ496_011719 [Pomphorhynchus laevis]
MKNVSLVNINDLSDLQLESIFLNLGIYRDFLNLSLVCRRWYHLVHRYARYRRSQLRSIFSNVTIKNADKYSRTCKFKSEIIVPQSLHPYVRIHQSCCQWKNYIIMFGGSYVGNDALFNDMWKFDITFYKWHRIQARKNIPSGRCRAYLCPIYNNTHLLLYGGYSISARSSSTPGRELEFLQDLHIFDIQNNEWSEKPAGFGYIPVNSYDSSTCAVFVPKIDSLIVLSSSRPNDSAADNDQLPFVFNSTSVWGFSMSQCYWVKIETIAAPAVCLFDTHLMISTETRIVVLAKRHPIYMEHSKLFILDLCMCTWTEVEFNREFPPSMAPYYKFNSNFGSNIFYTTDSNGIFVMKLYGTTDNENKGAGEECNEKLCAFAPVVKNIHPNCESIFNMIDPLGMSMIVFALCTDRTEDVIRRFFVFFNISLEDHVQ